MKPLPKPWQRLQRRTWLDGSRIAAATNLGINTHELRCKKFDLRVDLLLDHRLCWLRSDYGVRVPMHNLPLTIFFRSKVHRSLQSVRGDLLPCADLGLGPLYLYNVG